jgi:hypothetical protein
MISHKEWVFPESGSDRSAFYYTKWCKDAGIMNIPTTAVEFVQTVDKQAKRIELIPDGKYYKVRKREWRDQ